MQSKSQDAIEALLLTEQQAATSLALSPRTLWNMRSNGEIPCVRIGRSVRYAVADLKAWIDRSKVLLAPCLS